MSIVRSGAAVAAVAAAALTVLGGVASAGPAEAGGEPRGQRIFISPGGYYKLYVEPPSPPSRGEAPRGWHYALVDGTDDEVLWTRHQPMAVTRQRGWAPDGEGSPHTAWVDDLGVVVVRTDDDALLVLDPLDGIKLLQVRAPALLPADERARYAPPGAVGATWSAYSRWAFLEVPHGAEGRRSSPSGPTSYFVIRTWWDRRIAIDVDAAQVVALEGTPAGPDVRALGDARTAELLDAIDAAERSWVLETLDRAARTIELDGEDAALGSEVMTATHLAGRLGVEGAAPLLRQLEGSSFVGARTARWRQHTVRQLAQLSLRRLGERPSDAPAVVTLGPLGRPLATSVARDRRAERVHLVVPGMPLADAVQLLGHPDAVANGVSRVLDFDVEARRIVDAPRDGGLAAADDGDRVARIASVESITPAVWADGNRREASLFRRMVLGRQERRSPSGPGGDAAPSPAERDGREAVARPR